jgi:hypothetical protein
VLLLLNAILAPNERYKYLIEGVSRQYKPTIRDAQESMITLSPTINDFWIKYAALVKRYEIYNWKCQPMIFAIGKEYTKIEFIYVIYDGIYYKFNNLVDAVDLCFKLIWVFNLSYQKESSLVWHFIQDFFYGIKYGKKSPKINILIQKLNDL